ncbi:GNAT family N-acetyltransferase [Gryllotalpicola koreensis]
MNQAASAEQTVRIERVEWDDPRAAALRAEMDAEIAPRYAYLNDALTPEQLAVRAEAFVLDPATLRGVYLALDADGTPLGHAALRRLEAGGAVEWELKRLVTVTAARGRGVGSLLIEAVETDAAAAGASRVVLQTGVKQPEAIALYERLGYQPIAAYPPYAGRVPEGVYYAKELG